MKKSGGGKVVSHIRELVEPIADAQELYLWDIEYVKEGATHILRITIDKEDGVTVDDCEKFHRAINPIIDEDDPIEESYVLEVTSPGVERELKCEDHIVACEGWDVEVKLYAPIGGSKLYRGVLMGYNEEGTHIAVKCDDAIHLFAVESIAGIRTTYDWDADLASSADFEGPN